MSLQESTAAAEFADNPLIPWDKSWTIRMGVRDLIHDYDDTAVFLGSQRRLSDDLIALQEATAAWPGDEPVSVRESGTLLRCLRFVSWKFGLDKEITGSGTLLGRDITQDPSIVNLPQTELLELDNGTSQWASAAVLAGDEERLEDPPHKLPYKLKLTYDAVAHWEKRRGEGLAWLPRRDETIGRQAAAYLKLLGDETKPTFKPLQAEDYCFAVVFDYINPEEGEKRWPSLRGHESDRITEMLIATEQASAGKEVTSRDHRVVQAIAMWGRLVERQVSFAYPDAVNKSWPEFWYFMKHTT